jgi:hypothetical protein
MLFTTKGIEMKVSIIAIALACSTMSFASEIQKCEPGMLPRFVCKAVPSDDGIYRLTETPITVCHGNRKIQAVSMGGGSRNVYNAKLKESKKVLKYTLLDLEENKPVVLLTINKNNFLDASFKFIGDTVQQQRLCYKVR